MQNRGQLKSTEALQDNYSQCWRFLFPKVIMLKPVWASDSQNLSMLHLIHSKSNKSKINLCLNFLFSSPLLLKQGENSFALQVLQPENSDILGSVSLCWLLFFSSFNFSHFYLSLIATDVWESPGWDCRPTLVEWICAHEHGPTHWWLVCKNTFSVFLLIKMWISAAAALCVPFANTNQHEFPT